MNATSTIWILYPLNLSLAAWGLLVLTVLIALIAWEGWSNYRRMTPFNAVLTVSCTLMLILCVLGGYGDWVILNDPTNLPILLILTELLEVFLYGVVATYVVAIWLRGGSVVSGYNQRRGYAVKTLVCLIPCVIFITVALDASFFYCNYAGINVPGFYESVVTVFDALPGILAVIFDLIVTITFIQFLSGTRLTSEETDIRFLIISRYGIVSSCFMIGLFGISAIKEHINDDFSTDQVLLLCITVCANGMVTSMVAMKASLCALRSAQKPPAHITERKPSMPA